MSDGRAFGHGTQLHLARDERHRHGDVDDERSGIEPWPDFIEQGETITVTLTFEKAGTVDVVLPIEAAAADAPTAEHAH